jgi:peptidoglycan/LPS O-acetylase OafA/YrhL
MERGIPQRIPELDGLRGLAILLVVVWHYVGVPEIAESPLSWIAGCLRYTWSGVDLFFVLSGFLIGGILLDQRDSPKYFQAFYARRICRIFPLYFLWLALFLVLVVVWTPFLTASSPLQRLFQDPLPIWSYATFTQNFWMAARSTFGPAWLGITWSLAIEEQFYLLLPVLIRFVAVRQLPFVLASLAVGAPVFRLLCDPTGRYASMVLLPSRADSLLLGVLCACLIRRQGLRAWLVARRRWLYVFMILQLLMLAVLSFLPAVVEASPGSSFYTRFAVLYSTVLLIAVTERHGAVTLLVRNRWIRNLGLHAYGVYLFHQAVSGLVHGLILRQEPSFHTALQRIVTLGAFASTLALAAFSWRFFEKPLIDLGHSVRYGDDAPGRSRPGQPMSRSRRRSSPEVGSP